LKKIVAMTKLKTGTVTAIGDTLKANQVIRRREVPTEGYWKKESKHKSNREKNYQVVWRQVALA
jgi:hypothetical protein